MEKEELDRFVEIYTEYEELDFRLYEQALKMLKQIGIKNYGINDMNYIPEKRHFNINYSIFCGEYCDEYIIFPLDWFANPNWADEYHKMIVEKKKASEEQKKQQKIKEEEERQYHEYQLFIRLKEKYKE